MSSATARTTTMADRRSNAGAPDNVTGRAPRISVGSAVGGGAANSSFSSRAERPESRTERQQRQQERQERQERMDRQQEYHHYQQHQRQRSAAASPQPSLFSAAGAAGTSHKRSASGNPRPASRTAATTSAADEQRRTEKTVVTTRETLLVTRTRSPERRGEKERERERERERAARQKERERERVKETTVPPVVEPQQPTSVPWNGEVSLVPHTTAPLASRVSIPPSASDVPASREPRPLHELTLEAQEAVILEDMLFALMGYEGQYIRFARTYHASEERERLSGPDFRILPGLDPSLQDLAMSMLKMAKHYCSLETFVDVLSRDEYGAVNHALCASIRKFLQDYLVMMAQLETQFLTNDSFTLHVLNIHTLPTSQMMFQLYSLAHELSRRNSLLDDEGSDDSSSGGEDDYENILQQLRDGMDGPRGGVGASKICKGGAVLGLISKRLETISGDPAARALLTTLLRDASRPYMRMLNEWLHRGGIDDPHAEFLVKELRSIRRETIEEDYTDEYWERRYTIREQDVPPQLEPVRDKVLLAGKYLNVVRECGGVDVSKEVRDVPLSFDDSRFLDNVNAAYAHANESLMRLLLTTHALPARLQSLKHYFFLDPSDYFSYFLELGASELRKPVRTVNTAKLQSLLDLVLRQPGSAVSLDPFKDAVKVEMNEIGLTAALQRVVRITGIEQGETLPAVTSGSNAPAVEADRSAVGFSSLQLDYAVPFPVSLVVSRKTVWRYQALFRYLLSLRHLESQLASTWQTHTRGIVWAHKSASRPAIETWKRRVWTLRARMLVFVQQLLYFCTSEVIEKNWQGLMARVRGSAESRTVDELIHDHVDFLDSCLKECMLTNSKLLRIHSKLMQSCSIFAAYTSWLSRELEKTDPDLSGTTKPPNMTDKDWHMFQEIRSQKAPSSTGPADPNTSGQDGGGGHDERMANLFEIIRKWEANFSRHLQILLDALNHYAATETVVLLSLCARLSTANQGTEYAGRIADDDVGS